MSWSVHAIGCLIRPICSIESSSLFTQWRCTRSRAGSCNRWAKVDGSTFNDCIPSECGANDAASPRPTRQRTFQRYRCQREDGGPASSTPASMTPATNRESAPASSNPRWRRRAAMWAPPRLAAAATRATRGTPCALAINGRVTASPFRRQPHRTRRAG